MPNIDASVFNTLLNLCQANMNLNMGQSNFQGNYQNQNTMPMNQNFFNPNPTSRIEMNQSMHQTPQTNQFQEMRQGPMQIPNTIPNQQMSNAQFSNPIPNMPQPTNAPKGNFCLNEWI